MKRVFPRRRRYDAVARPVGNGREYRKMGTTRPRLGRDEIDLRKIRTIALCVPAEQPQTHDRGMGANEEIRQYSGAQSSRGPVALKRLTCKKKRRARRGYQDDICLVQEGIESFDGRETHSQFGVHHVVDDERPKDGRSIQLRDRPSRPAWVIGDEIEQHIRVDQCHAG